MRIAVLLLVALVCVTPVVHAVQRLHEHVADRRDLLVHMRRHKSRLVARVKGEAAEGRDTLSAVTLNRLFAETDEHADGYLTEKELESLLSEYAAATIKAMDLNGDNKLSASEFSRGFLALSRPKRVSHSDLKVDFIPNENGERHRTAEFNRFHVTEDNNLVVRRGAFWRVRLRTKASLSQEELNQIKVHIGGQIVDSVGAGAQNKFFSLSSKFRATVVEESDQSEHRAYDLKLFLAANFPAGRFPISIEVPRVEAAKGEDFGEIMVLFNPWSKYDATYMKETDLLEEYVLGATTAIWTGSAPKGGEMQNSEQLGLHHWEYNQAEILDIVLDVLKHCPEEHRDDPILISRCFSWMLNSNRNKHGVLTGKWAANDEAYFPHTLPWHWTSGRAIFSAWRDAGEKPAKYGQCFIFGGILTSALRSLGIPSRTITNFDSGHDTVPFDRVVDEYNDHEMVWNYHVWVDAWMKRPDLNLGPVWNAVDATPQEKSEGRYQMGPAALPLVRRGVIEGCCDAEFVLAEVNSKVWSDELGMKYDSKLHGNMVLDMVRVGRYISTQQPRCTRTTDSVAECRHDITHLYKVQEDPFVVLAADDPRLHMSGSELEGHVALLESQSNARVQASSMFLITVDPKEPVLGAPLYISVTPGQAAPLPSDTWLVNFHLALESILYTGRHLAVVAEYRETCYFGGSGDRACQIDRWALNVAVDSYVHHLQSGSFFRIRASFRKAIEDHKPEAVAGEQHDEQLESSFTEYYFEDVLNFVSPTLAVRTEPVHVHVGVPHRYHVSFYNPLPVPLTNLQLSLSTPDYDRSAVFSGAVRPQTLATLVTAPTSIAEAGSAKVTFSLVCKQLKGMTGMLSFYVQPSEDPEGLGNDEDLLPQGSGDDEEEQEVKRLHKSLPEEAIDDAKVRAETEILHDELQSSPDTSEAEPIERRVANDHKAPSVEAAEGEAEAKGEEGQKNDGGALQAVEGAEEELRRAKRAT